MPNSKTRLDVHDEAIVAVDDGDIRQFDRFEVIGIDMELEVIATVPSKVSSFSFSFPFCISG